MKITVLVDNNSRIDNYLYSEAGFSLYIETGDKKILFDSGYSSIFYQNAKALGINLENVTDIIMSHGHDDHTRGLNMPEVQVGNRCTTFTAHPDLFEQRFEYSCPLSREELQKKYTLNLTASPVKITDKLYFLGEIEGNRSIDTDDSALVYITDQGLFIITGCSHSGIINIIEQAKKVTGINKLYGILGGMHFVEMPDNDIINTAEFLRNENIVSVYPCHCCDLNSKIILAKYIPVKEVCTGDIIEVR